MKNGTSDFPKFEELPDEYRKNPRTKSAYSKRKAIYLFIINYEGGAEKCLEEFSFCSPTWLYDNKIRKART
jgi:hypothetical protein